MSERDDNLKRLAAEMGLDADAEQRIGGIYAVVVHGGQAYR